MVKSKRLAERILVDGILVHPNAKHGTYTGYVHWGCRCRECREACITRRKAHEAKGVTNYNASSERSRRYRHSQRIMRDGSLYHEQAPHGEPKGYIYWGCRCSNCYKAYRDYYGK